MLNQKLILIIGVTILVVGGLVFLGKDSVQQTTQNASNESTSAVTNIAPHYVWYSPETLANAQNGGRVVLYFWASWCPTCKVLDTELKDRGNELPADLTVLKINYDTEKELKKKYQVASQHTLIQVDRNGEVINKWLGGNIDVIKQELQ